MRNVEYLVISLLALLSFGLFGALEALDAGRGLFLAGLGAYGVVAGVAVAWLARRDGARPCPAPSRRRGFR